MEKGEESGPVFDGFCIVKEILPGVLFIFGWFSGMINMVRNIEEEHNAQWR